MSDVLRGEAFVSRKRSKTYKSGRTCSETGCTTQLSIYNSSDRCSVHPERHKKPRTRGRKF